MQAEVEGWSGSVDCSVVGDGSGGGGKDLALCESNLKKNLGQREQFGG